MSLGLTVSYGSVETFDWAHTIDSEIGVWQYIAKDRTCPVNEMVVSMRAGSIQAIADVFFPRFGQTQVLVKRLRSISLLLVTLWLT